MPPLLSRNLFLEPEEEEERREPKQPKQTLAKVEKSKKKKKFRCGALMNRARSAFRNVQLKYSSFSIVEGELEGDVYSGGRRGREVESTSGVANFESG